MVILKSHVYWAAMPTEESTVLPRPATMKVSIREKDAAIRFCRAMGRARGSTVFQNTLLKYTDLIFIAESLTKNLFPKEEICLSY